MSSKFAIPFFQKSPLYGAYTSGADGMVTVSDAKHFAKLQSDAAGIVEKAYAPKENSCSNLDQKLSNDKISNAAYETLSKKCANQEKENYLNSYEGQKDLLNQETSRIGKESAKRAGETLQGYSGEFDMMKSWGIAKKQKEEKAKKSMDTYFRNEMEKQAYKNLKK